MSVQLTLLSVLPYIYIPQSLAGRVLIGISWILCLLLVIYLARRWQKYNQPLRGRSRWLFIVLMLLTPVSSLFIGLRMPAHGALPLPWVPVEPTGPALMFFSALPWVLAGGMLGPLPAALLAVGSGVLQALWESHNPFMPLELALLALIFSGMVNQRYRTRLYIALRHPIFALILLALTYPVMSLVSTFLTVDGNPAVRLDFALSGLAPTALATAGELLLAGIFAELMAIGLPEVWKRPASLSPSPAEKSLQARFLHNLAPLAFLLVVIMLAGDWLVAERAARQMLRERMADAAQLAAQSIPYFMSAGQNLLKKVAEDQRLLNDSPAELAQILAEERIRVPFFTQLFLLDAKGQTLASDPEGKFPEPAGPPEQQLGIQNILAGVPVQIFTLPPKGQEKAARVVFMVPVTDRAGRLQGVLVGRTDLEANPMTQPILTTLDSLSSSDGQGVLLDDNGKIVYHPERSFLWTDYVGRRAETGQLFDEATPNGTRRLVYYQPVTGSQWAVAMWVPAGRAQGLALDIAMPLMGMILILGLASWWLLRFNLRTITTSLRGLALQSADIAQGKLDQPLNVSGEDEVGQLRRAFEQMRVSLKARLEELNRLVVVSQGVASSLEMGQSVNAVLDAALASGASSANIVLAPAAMPDIEDGRSALPSYRAGPAGDLYQDLDEQIVSLNRQQERLVISNLSRTRILHFKPGAPRPKALLAVALRHEHQYYGSLWVAYDQPHQFSEEEVRFIVTLAGYASLAAANAHLFLSAEVGRQRLSAILASTPDPVLVTDQENRLTLVNPAAWRVLGLGVNWDEGLPIERVIKPQALLDLLRSSGNEKQTAEVTLADGKTYYASASSIQVEGRRVGRVCVLRDISHFKHLDALKSEFVATVSHDLRAPLTLIRGYASMLDMVGQLNEQQISYMNKIVAGVDHMSHLVSSLLDLGRIEAGIGLQLEMISAKDLVARVVGLFQAQATQKRVKLIQDVPEHTLPLIEADPALLQQALSNLVDNAIKYTDAGGEVQVRAYARHDQMIFEVSDTGIGIAPVDQPRLFEKFYRGAQSGVKQPRGSGLGLSIVKSIADRHAGRVWVESQLGKGSIFYLALPLKNPTSRSGQ